MSDRDGGVKFGFVALFLFGLGTSFGTLGLEALWPTTPKAEAQEEPTRIRSTFEKPPCDEDNKGVFWSLESPTGEPRDQLWVCNGHLWVEAPNAGVNMIQPWAVLVLYAGGANQILLFEDGNEASLQARVFYGLGLKSIECVAIYHLGDLMDVEPPSCNVREK